MYTRVFRQIRQWMTNRYQVNSRFGDVLLNVAAGSAIGATVSIGANVLVTAVNGGRMPAAIEVGSSYRIGGNHTLANDTTNLKILCDWIVFDEKAFFFLQDTPLVWFATILRIPIGKSGIASPGDIGMWIFISVGFMAFLLSIIFTLWDYAKKA